jgi:hypothetical protein
MIFHQQISRPLRSADWERYRHYAPFVRAFDFDSQKDSDVNATTEVWDSEVPPFDDGGHSYLLPNLTSIRWFIRVPEEVLVLCCFITANLTSLEIHIGAEDGFIRDLVRSVQHIIPTILKLSLHAADATSRSLTKAATKLLKIQQNHLRHLTLHIETFKAVVHHIPMLPNLTSLQLTGYIHSWGLDDSNAFDHLPKCLPALRKTDGKLDSEVGFWETFFSVLGHPLHEIVLDGLICDEDEKSHVYGLFVAIGQNCSGLHSLVISDLTFEDRPTLESFPDLLKPLAGCPKLVKLDVCSDCDEDNHISLTLSNNDVAELAKSWPNLEVLRLATGEPMFVERPYNYDDKHPLSLDVIAILIKSCRRLRHLTLTLNTMFVPPPASLGGGLPSSSLETLNFSNSWIDYPFDVAVFLGDVCPAAGIIACESWEELQPDNWIWRRRDGWDQVKRIVRTLQDFRRSTQAQLQRLEHEVEALREGDGSSKGRVQTL